MIRFFPYKLYYLKIEDMSILRFYQYLETKRQSKHATGRCSKHDSGERCHEEAHMHQDPSGMLARIPFGLTTGPIEGAEIPSRLFCHESVYLGKQDIYRVI